MENKEKLEILEATYKQNNEALVQMEIHRRYLTDMLATHKAAAEKDPQRKPLVLNTNNAILDLEENRARARAHQVIILGMRKEIKDEKK